MVSVQLRLAANVSSMVIFVRPALPHEIRNRFRCFVVFATMDKQGNDIYYR